MRSLREWADFGLDVSKKPAPAEPGRPQDGPIKRVNIEFVIEDLKKIRMGVKEAVGDFFGEAQWGDGPGAVKVSFGPYGGLRAVIRKLCVDLQGESKWICKDVMEVKNAYDTKQDTLIYDLYERLKEIDGQGIEAPKAGWDGLERLVLNMAQYLKRNSTERPLMYDGTRRLKKNEHYIIHFGCTGMGRQRRGQKRLDQFQVDVTYERDSGCIKVVGQELGDEIARYRWVMDQSQYIEYFMPEQKEEEILKAVLSHFNSY